MKLKFMLGDDNRRVTLSDSARFAQVYDAAALAYGLSLSSGFVLKFVDDDGDACTLSNDSELAEAREGAGTGGTLKVRVVLPEGASVGTTFAKPPTVGPSSSVIYEMQQAKYREELQRKRDEAAKQQELTFSIVDALEKIKAIELQEKNDRAFAEAEAAAEERARQEEVERAIAERRRRDAQRENEALLSDARDEVERLRVECARSKNRAKQIRTSATTKANRVIKLERDLLDLQAQLDRSRVAAAQEERAAETAELEVAATQKRWTDANELLRALEHDTKRS